jgi:hypothetical protein
MPIAFILAGIIQYLERGKNGRSKLTAVRNQESLLTQKSG